VPVEAVQHNQLFGVDNGGPTHPTRPLIYQLLITVKSPVAIKRASTEDLVIRMGVPFCYVGTKLLLTYCLFLTAKTPRTANPEAPGQASLLFTFRSRFALCVSAFTFRLPPASTGRRLPLVKRKLHRASMSLVGWMWVAWSTILRANTGTSPHPRASSHWRL